MTLNEAVEAHGRRLLPRVPTPERALACAVAIQRVLAEHRREAGFAPQVRIGVHEAQATQGDGDYKGKGVHTAARVAGIAEAARSWSAPRPQAQPTSPTTTRATCG